MYYDSPPPYTDEDAMAYGISLSNLHNTYVAVDFEELGKILSKLHSRIRSTAEMSVEMAVSGFSSERPTGIVGVGDLEIEAPDELRKSRIFLHQLGSFYLLKKIDEIVCVEMVTHINQTRVHPNGEEYSITPERRVWSVVFYTSSSRVCIV